VKTYTAIEVRRQFGRILDEAAAGERIVIERAGQPIAGLVPLADVLEHDPVLRTQRQIEALREAARLGRRFRVRYGPFEQDAAAIVRADRERDGKTPSPVGDPRTSIRDR
jgi:prevent-host-death family protein